MTDARLPVVVYGATGFTGKLICDELDRQKIPFAIGGRSKEKLQALAAQLASKPQAFVAAIDDPGALRSFASKGRVLLSVAGPFAKFGGPVQEAAIDSGAHWLDTTGELTFAIETKARDEKARAKGVALINAVGFDIIPTDAAAGLAAEGLGDIEEVRIAIAAKAKVSQGTARSALGIMVDGGHEWRNGALVKVPLAGEKWLAPFPSPLGTRGTLSFPLLDLLACPVTTGAKNVRTFFSLGPAFRQPALVRLAVKAASSGPAMKLADEIIKRLPEGPSAEDRTKTRFMVVAEAKATDGRTKRAWVSGNDPYELTALSAVYCAKRAAADDFDGKGFLSPAKAFGAKALLDALAPLGVRYGES